MCSTKNKIYGNSKLEGESIFIREESLDDQYILQHTIRLKYKQITTPEHFDKQLLTKEELVKTVKFQRKTWGPFSWFIQVE